MSTSALTPSFGLGYLNEQQRFVRDKKPAHVSAAKPSQFSDISAIQSRRVTARKVNPDIVEAVRELTRAALPVLVKVSLQNPTVHTESMMRSTTAEDIEADGQKISWVSRLRSRKVIPVVTASVALVSGLVIFGMTIRQNHQAAAQVATIVQKSQSSLSTSDTAEDAPPSEAPVTAAAIGNYKVNPMEPRTITIKKINVHARVMPMGILKSGAMATPRNTYDAGWYNGSARPGEGGAVTILGHVMGGTKPGLLYDLKKLVAGDVINIERGDGVTFDYKVISKEQVASADVDTAKLLVPVTAGKAGLNIMTCGGKYLADKDTFSDRVIVYTEQI